MVSKKDKRRGGRSEPRMTMPKKIVIAEALDANTTFWDDWNDWRDGMRDLSDRSLIRPLQSYWAKRNNVKKDNAKHKRHERIRTAMKRMMLRRK